MPICACATQERLCNNRADQGPKAVKEVKRLGNKKEKNCFDDYLTDGLAIDVIHDTRHLCTRSRIDGIKAMSRGISDGKQVIKFANNTSNGGRVCLFYQNKTTIS